MTLILLGALIVLTVIFVSIGRFLRKKGAAMQGRDNDAPR